MNFIYRNYCELISAAIVINVFVNYYSRPIEITRDASLTSIKKITLLNTLGEVVVPTGIRILGVKVEFGDTRLSQNSELAMLCLIQRHLVAR